MSVACARTPDPATGGPPAVDRGVEAREATEALRAAEGLLEADRPEEAVARADSLYASVRDEPALASVAERALWVRARGLEATGDLDAAAETLGTLLERGAGEALGREAAARLATILHATGRDEEAFRLLLEMPAAAGEAEIALMREAALRLSLEQLEALADRHPLAAGPPVVLHAEFARALALGDRLDSARRVARRVARTAESESAEAELAEALAALETRTLRRARIGAVLPLTGRFQAVGELLREGMSLALEEYRSSRPQGPELELVVLDDGSAPERAVELAGQLETEGALAILGPVRSEPFAEAARRRSNPRLLMISPTATQPSSSGGAYTLWANERRENEVAHDVGEWIAGVLGLRRAATLHPATAGGRAAAEGFESGFTGRGGVLVASRAYDPDSTTFAGPISELAVLEPDAVFVAAATAPEVLQIAPQLAYYGLDHSVIAGGTAWSEPTVVRRLDPFSASHRVVGTPVDRTAAGSGWDRFRERYEMEYRKSLRDNILPALGYDAFKLAVGAIERAGLPLPGAISRAVTALGEIEGATGVLRLESEGRTVDRRTLILLVVDGRLVPAERGAVLAWLDRARVRADSIAQARADSIARAGRAGEPPR